MPLLCAEPLYPGYDFYPRALGRLLRRHNNEKSILGDLVFICLLPLLQINLSAVRHYSSNIREKFEGPDVDESFDLSEEKAPKTFLYYTRDQLRWQINNLQDDWSYFRRFMRTKFDCDASKNALYRNFENDIHDVVEGASRMENQIREHLQLQTGILALKESKKSIEVSNQQIQEGKRVKTFTILAFIYVPLNLATSIYGMNLQQLNNSGQTLWKFVITAIVAMLVTAGTWYVFEAANTYRIWLRECSEKKEESDRTRKSHKGPTNPSFKVAERVAMIVWLLRHEDGYGSCVRDTGAWWKILVNSSEPMTVVSLDDEERGQKSAGNLVSEVSLGQLDRVNLGKCYFTKTEKQHPNASIPLNQAVSFAVSI
ncbi:MAG: hypothetical protein Q9170_000690 [Blastenia crenularia]